MSPSAPRKKPGTTSVTQENLTLKQRILFAAAANRAGLSMAQLDEILERVGDDRGSLEAFFRREKEKLAPVIDWYDVPINRRLTAKEIIAGLIERLDWVHADITAENFPVERDSDEESPSCKEEVETQVKMAVVHFDRLMTMVEVQNYFEDNGLRAATLEELAAFQQKQPELQRKYLIVALGPRVPDSEGYVRVPYLDRKGSERNLYLAWGGLQLQYYESCRFLALPN